MPNVITFLRGNKKDIPKLKAGTPAFCLDSKELYVGDGTTNIKFLNENDVIRASDAEAIAGTNDINVITPKNLKVAMDNKETTTKVSWDRVTGKPSTFPPSTHVHDLATSTNDGFISKSDKSKLDGVASSANNYVHPNVGTTGTYPKVTVNAQGHVTGGTSLVATDIPILTASKISDFNTQVRTSTLDQMAAPLSNVSVNNKRIINVANGSSNGDAVNLGQLNTVVNNAVSGVSNTIHTPVADLAACKAIIASRRMDKMLLNIETMGLYRWDAENKDVDNNKTIIRPTDIATSVAGRWLKMNSSLNEHNALDNMQGGTTGEYYHLTNAQLTKLNGVATGANNYVHPSTHPASIIVQDANNRFSTDTEKSNWNAKANTSVVTTTANGLMSKEDKVKLNGVATGAQVNQNAFSNIKVGSTTVVADNVTDTLEIVAGTNVTITPDATNDKLTIASKDTVYTHPTTSGNKHIPSSGATGQILRWASDGTAAWSSAADIKCNVFRSGGELGSFTATSVTSSFTIPNMTIFKEVDLIFNGLMLIEKKDYTIVKGTGVVTLGFSLKIGETIDYEVYSTSFSYNDLADIPTGGPGTPAIADNLTTTAKGKSLDASQGKILNDTKADKTIVSTSVNGLMSKEDKVKLNGVATGANNYTHPNVGTVGTYPKVTVNAQGHVTGGSGLVVADIPNLTKSKITDFPTSLPANGGNADTVGGLQPWEFATLDSRGNTHINGFKMRCQFDKRQDGRFNIHLENQTHNISVDHAYNSDMVGGIGSANLARLDISPTFSQPVHISYPHGLKARHIDGSNNEDLYLNYNNGNASVYMNTVQTGNINLGQTIHDLKQSVVNGKQEVVNAIDGRLGYTSGLTAQNHSHTDYSWWITHKIPRSGITPLGNNTSSTTIVCPPAVTHEIDHTTSITISGKLNIVMNPSFDVGLKFTPTGDCKYLIDSSAYWYDIPNGVSTEIRLGKYSRMQILNPTGGNITILPSRWSGYVTTQSVLG